MEHKHPDSSCGDRVHDPLTGCAWQIPASRTWNGKKYDSAGKVQESMKVKNFPGDKVELLSYANELQVGKKQVFMQNDGVSIKKWRSRKQLQHPHNSGCSRYHRLI